MTFQRGSVLLNHDLTEIDDLERETWNVANAPKDT